MTESILLDDLDKLQNLQEKGEVSGRTTEALLSIVFAHALSTEEGGSPEPFYRRTMSLLNLRTLSVPSLNLSKLVKYPAWPSAINSGGSPDSTPIEHLPAKPPAFYGELDDTLTCR